MRIADVVDLLPSALSDESGKDIEILRVGLDGVNGRILLAQMAQEFVYRFFHQQTDGAPLPSFLRVSVSPW